VEVTHVPSPAPMSWSGPPVVELERAARFEPEENGALVVDEERRIALGKGHVSRAIANTPMLKTIPMTTTQMTIGTNFLFFIVF
jgi:hypothetical protein